jgi:hypothetical protein
MTKVTVAFHSFENMPKTHTHTLLDASTSKNDVDKTKYMFMSHEQNAGECCNTQQNKFYGRVAKFTYFVTTLKNQSFIWKEIKSRLN